MGCCCSRWVVIVVGGGGVGDGESEIVEMLRERECKEVYSVSQFRETLVPYDI